MQIRILNVLPFVLQIMLAQTFYCGLFGLTRSPVILNSNDITKHVFSIKKRECNSSENGLNSTQSKNKGDVFIFIFLERGLVFELT